MRIVVALAVVLSACTAAPITSDAGSDAESAVDAPDAIATCTAAVDAVLARCTNAGRRLCVLRAYRTECARGRADVITAMMACLSSASCETARDAGDDAACVAAVVAAHRDSSHDALTAAWCACDAVGVGCPDTAGVEAAELAMLADADADAIASCLSSGCAMTSYCLGSVPLGAATHMCAMVPP